ncbi:MAG TPA: TIGR00300 family protein [Acidimicrobiales bacterium]
MGVEVVELQGHIIDSLILAKVLDLIADSGATYEVTDFSLGRTSTDPSRAVIEIQGDDVLLERLLDDLQVHGANRLDQGDCALQPCDRDGVLPEGFYSTTNLDTDVRVGGRWIPVANPEMDCAIVVRDGTATTMPMHRVRAGDLVVVGRTGIRVHPLRPSASLGVFEFMSSEVSSEKPKGLQLARVAERLRTARAEGGRVLAVCGPAVIHTGGGPALAQLVRDGWVHVLFAGNGFAAHDIESNVLGTSLGVSIKEGVPTEGGHSNHLRVINEVRRHGSIANAVSAGYIRGGVMYECVRAGVPFVLGGSVRDDGPLPDVYADVVAAADAMREQLEGATVALMLASTLHAIATGNLLPARVDTFCVDINTAVLTKLADRGSRQAMGIVTDVGPFLNELAAELAS